MDKRKIFQGDSEIINSKAEVSGNFVEIDSEKYYQIQNFHEMPEFFISIVSDSNHWMFISSNGSLSAGRKDRDNALFPYFTVDKIHDYKDITGSKSIFLVTKKDKIFIWEPFTDESQKIYRIKRNLYKNFFGNKIIFEEINEDLGVGFRYGWFNSDKFGFIKKSVIFSTSHEKLKVELLDGVQNILPSGSDYAFQNEYSNLLDAYKKNELIEGSTLGLFMLSSIPVDRAEPSEALKTTTVWSVGIEKELKILISSKQVDHFRKGNTTNTEHDIRASRGAYFLNTKIELEKNEEKTWYTIAEINQDSSDVNNLKKFIVESENLQKLVEEDITKGTENLKKMVSFADGIQISDTEMCYARHYSNTLYNIMRGGVFTNNYIVNTNDFNDYLWQINKLVCKERKAWLDNLPENISYSELKSFAEETGDTDLIRIVTEYLPLTFSRRHGDPSRPWNLFSIETSNTDGQVKYNYEGNWRDIFQNWEALCYSFPEFIEGMISKFVNASTIDGYNPYRIMRNGIDWESPDPDDSWAYIGYWGDHQIIYLQKLLELSDSFHPGKLDDLLISDIFTYANVPYRIKPYSKIIQNPKDTVVFDHKLNVQIENEASHLGADAKLLKDKSRGQIYRVNLTEKILVALLSKLSNFIPESGIWLNTQRPEWNDANNALVGNGTSMVTLYYLRRFLKFWESKFQNSSIDNVDISEEVEQLFRSIFEYFEVKSSKTDKGFSDSERRDFADFLGSAHSKYRTQIYNYSFSGEKKQISISDLKYFLKLCLKYIDQSTRINKRNDGLYHAYNLVTIDNDTISIRHLYEMLEGQVAVLSSGLLSAQESLDVLSALKKSKVFRPDQYSYMLYPDRQLPRFIDKNIIPEEYIKESQLFNKLLDNNETSIISTDYDGKYHFNAEFRNADELEKALDKLHTGSYSQLVEAEKDTILEVYEKVFDHQSFTGRSGTFYGYEGLGSIYWHMVSKLLLATQECYFRAVDENAENSIVSELKNHYYEIKAGIGLYKSPNLYGAFPMDAYSHTPGNAGVKQPGLTGQVKEDVISRFGELGIQINNGSISFNPSLINHEEFLIMPGKFDYYSIDGDVKSMEIESGQLAFTFCQVPVIYNNRGEDCIEVYFTDGEKRIVFEKSLGEELSKKIFARTGEIAHVIVNLNEGSK